MYLTPVVMISGVDRVVIQYLDPGCDDVMAGALTQTSLEAFTHGRDGLDHDATLSSLVLRRLIDSFEPG